MMDDDVIKVNVDGYELVEMVKAINELAYSNLLSFTMEKSGDNVCDALYQISRAILAVSSSLDDIADALHGAKNDT